MYWRLTPEERRIMERTRREGEKADGTDGEYERGRGQLLRSALAWVSGIALLVFLAMLMVWIGTLV